MNPIAIFIISFLGAAILVLLLVVVFILKQIKRSTKLKARQYSLYGDYAVKGETVFLGDSLTEFFRIEEFFHAHNPYNRGIAGDTTDDVLERLESNVIDLEPSKVFLQIGTNDLEARKKGKKEMTVENIKKILSRLQEALPEGEIYFLSLYPVNRKAKFFSPFFVRGRKNEDIVKINAAVKTFCEEKGITFIDVYSRLVDENGNLNKDYTFEGLHLSFEGYKKVVEAVKPYL
ncbi:MAG TPA: lysophospholipase [Acholeplasmataceae bacterium]|nr:lysophospholipase [Acholeplasmataceae bacterium]